MRKTEEPEGKKELIPEALNWIIRYINNNDDGLQESRSGRELRAKIPSCSHAGKPRTGLGHQLGTLPSPCIPAEYPTQWRKGTDRAVTWFRLMNYWLSAKWVGSCFCLLASMEKNCYEWFILSHYSRAQIDNKSLKPRENIATSTLSHSPVFGGWVRSPSHFLDYEDFIDVCVYIYIHIYVYI